MDTNTGFAESMETYRSLIDGQLKSYSENLISDTRKNFGEYDAMVVEAYCSLLSRGGKRIRGALLINAYEMCGGKDREMILQAACAIEFMHTYILAIDDMQDQSDLRRGGPTVHKILETQSKNLGWRGDHKHVGLSLAKNAALIGNHTAQIMLQSLDVEPEIRSRVSILVNKTMIMTAHGQTGDIINEVNGEVTANDIDTVMLRKTAYYTILNPIQVGMLLAGCTEKELAIVVPYAMKVGPVFQITDDALTYTAGALDKDASVDIKDGKITHFILYARDHTTGKDLDFLNGCLGNRNLTQSDFERCVEVVKNSGAVDAIMSTAKDAVDFAVEQTSAYPESWNKENVLFLRELAHYLLKRSN